MAYELTGQFAGAGSVTVNLGNIQSETVSKSTGIVVINNIQTDADGNQSVDLTSPTRVFNIRTIKTSDSLATLNTILDQLDTWTAGTQDSLTLTFHSDLRAAGSGTGNYNVKILDWDFDWVAAQPTMLEIVLKMSEVE